MSTTNDSFNRPSNLESPEDLAYLPYRVDSAMLDRDRLKADRSATWEECMYLIDALMRKYETTYKNHKTDTSLIWMPYLFSRPADGTEIKNITTGEIYTVKETIVNPKTKVWEGIVRLTGIAYPVNSQAERLAFTDRSKYTRFTEDPSVASGTENQTSDGIIMDRGPMIPTVTYSLERKEPGSIDGTPFGSRKDYRKRVREFIKDPDSPSHTIEIRAQTFDNLIQFDCCTVDNFSANRLARWFEKFMELYEWVLKLNGVQQFLFLQRFNNTSVQKWRQDLVVRSLQYYFRTEEIEAISRRDLTSIQYIVNLDTEIEDTSTRYVAGQLVSGQITDQEYKSLFRDSNGQYLFGNIYFNDGNL